MSSPDPTKKCCTLNEFRMRSLRLHHGATDEHSDDSIPKGRRDAFRAAVQHDKEFAARWFEKGCRSFGSKTGTWDDVPKNRWADALEYFGSGIELHENRCSYELSLQKIDMEEQSEAAFDREIGG